jgi:hypothetical protein
MKGNRERRGIAPFILNSAPDGKKFRYPGKRKLGGSHSQSGRFGEKYITHNGNRTLDQAALSLVTPLTNATLQTNQ